MKRRTKILFALLLCLLLPVTAEAAEVASGECGWIDANLTWVLDDTGTLTISGSGRMEHYSVGGADGDAPWYDYRDQITSLVLDDKITTIGSSAFYGCANITGELQLPEQLTQINYGAFGGCSGLTGDLVIPEGVTTVGDNAFYKCTGLNGQLVLPQSLTTIGKWAFRGCSGLTGTLTLPEGLTGMGADAFNGCSGLTGKVVIPAGVTSIADWAFMNCKGLTEIVFPRKLTSIGRYAFYNCIKLTGELVIPNGVTTIGDSAIRYCTGLTSVVLPNTVTSIGPRAFQSSSALKEIYFSGNAPSFDSYALDTGKALTAYYPAGDETWTEEIRIACGDNITWVEYVPAYGSCGENATWTFDEATGTLRISGSGQVTTYTGSDAPQPWEAWSEQITKIVVEDGVPGLGTYALRDHPALTEVELPATLEGSLYGTFRNCVSLTEVWIPENITELYWTFRDCTALKTVYLNDGLKEVGEGAFYGCAMLSEVYSHDATTQTSGDTVPESIETFGHLAFYGCSALQKLHFTGNAPTFAAPVEDSTDAQGSFAGCTLEVWCPMANDTWTDVIYKDYGGNVTWLPYHQWIAGGSCGENVNWELMDTGMLSIYGDGDMEDYDSASDAPWYVYRDQIDFIEIRTGVSRIGNRAFSEGYGNVTDLSVYNGVTSIGDRAFAGCVSVCEFFVPISVTSVGKEVFAGCTLTAHYAINSTNWSDSMKENYGGTITWVPYCTGSCSYGSPEFIWYGYDACEASFVCEDCGDNQIPGCEITAQTTPATELQEGKTVWTASVTFNGITYTDTKEETIPKLEHSHSYGKWYSDKENHWLQCAVCGEKKDMTAHTPGAEATEHNSQKCEICGRVLRTPLGLDWLFDRVQNDGFLPSGFYAKLMEQYADAIS